MVLLVSLLAGSIFGIGLIVAGMANPAKVLGFLDLAGNWDPSPAQFHYLISLGVWLWSDEYFSDGSIKEVAAFAMPRI